jgi:hypothetical protein
MAEAAFVPLQGFIDRSMHFLDRAKCMAGFLHFIKRFEIFIFRLLKGIAPADQKTDRGDGNT